MVRPIEKSVVDQLALELFRAGNSRTRSEPEVNRVWNESENTTMRAFYRRMARHILRKFDLTPKAG